LEFSFWFGAFAINTCAPVCVTAARITFGAMAIAGLVPIWTAINFVIPNMVVVELADFFAAMLASRSLRRRGHGEFPQRPNVMNHSAPQKMSKYQAGMDWSRSCGHLFFLAQSLLAFPRTTGKRTVNLPVVLWSEDFWISPVTSCRCAFASAFHRNRQ